MRTRPSWSAPRIGTLGLVGLLAWHGCGNEPIPPPIPRAVSLSGLPSFLVPGAAVSVTATLTPSGTGAATWVYAFSDTCQGSFPAATIGPIGDRVVTANWTAPARTTASCTLSVSVTAGAGPGGGVSDNQSTRIAYLVNDHLAPGEPPQCARPTHSSIGAAVADRAVADGSLIDLCPGTYPEALVIKRSLKLTGPAAAPESAVLQPPAATATGAIIEVGDVTDGAAIAPRVDIESLKIDGTRIAAAAPPEYRGVRFRPGSSGSLSRCVITGVKPGAVGVQTGVAVTVSRARVDVSDNQIRDYGKTAVSVFGKGAPFTVNVRNNRIAGTDPTAAGSQNSQNGVWYWESAVGEIAGNTFQDFGPSGPSNSKAGGAKVASDSSVGYAVGLYMLSEQGVVSIRGNTFTNVQGIFYDGRWYGTPAQRVAAVRAGDFLGQNTVTGGKYAVYGPLDEGGVIAGFRADDVDQLNYVLTDLDCSYYGSCTVVLGGPATYALLSAGVVPPRPVTLLARGGQVTVSYPGAVPAGVAAGQGVTLTTH